MRVGWTGHRPDIFQAPDEARRRLKAQVERVLGGGLDVEFICGGQRGVDTWAGQAAIERGVPFRLILPVPPDAFASEWTSADRDALRGLMARARDVRIVDERSALGPLAFDRRNEAVARESDMLVAVWTGLRQGGTFYTVCAAQAFGKPIESVILGASTGISWAGRGV